MSDKPKAELTHREHCYGCLVQYSFQGERAVLTDPDGRTHEFEEDLGMIAQGAPNALILAKTHAKRDEKRRADEKAAERTRQRAEQPPAPIATPKKPEESPESFVADSPIPGEKPNAPPLPPANPSTPPKRGK